MKTKTILIILGVMVAVAAVYYFFFYDSELITDFITPDEPLKTTAAPFGEGRNIDATQAPTGDGSVMTSENSFP